MAPLTPRKLERWTHAAEVNLGASLGHDRDRLAAEVNAGVAELWRIHPETYMVTRIDPAPARPDLVVCCLAGHGLREIVPALIDAARRQRLRGIRCHIVRRGMARMLAPFGFREVERRAPPRGYRDPERVLFRPVTPC